MIKLGTWGLMLACTLAILFLVAFQSKGADFDGDWLLKDLTCEELKSAYRFEVEILNALGGVWRACKDYAESPADKGHGKLHCALLKKEGEFVKGVANDIAMVYNIKCGQEKKKSPEYKIQF